MERHAAELFRDALALPVEARAELVDSLIESLDQSAEEGAEEAWTREIEHRLQQIDAGAVELLPWTVARERLRKRLDG
jgi:putative addiction module component (TIGR02574 family)